MDQLDLAQAVEEALREQGLVIRAEQFDDHPDLIDLNPLVMNREDLTAAILGTFQNHQDQEAVEHTLEAMREILQEQTSTEDQKQMDLIEQMETLMES